MNLKIRVSYLKGFPNRETFARFNSEEQLVSIAANEFTDEQLDTLVKRANENPDHRGARGLVQRIAAYRNVRSAPTGKAVGRLELLETALRATIEPTVNKWLFYDESDGYALPYYVKSIQYNKATAYSEAHVDVNLKAVMRGKDEGRTLTFRKDDLGEPVNVMLNEKGFYLETREAVEQFLGDVALYKARVSGTGTQYNAVGMGYLFNARSYLGYDEIAMEREGSPTRVVLDDESDDGEAHRSSRSSRHDETETSASTSYWTKKKSGERGKDEDEDEDEDAMTVGLPVHPYVKVFDLDKHEFVLIHIRSLSPYIYDKSAADKLVLDDSTKDLVRILVDGAGEVMEDIVAGKTGGTIVISTGPPGTGKTLTAQVFSERIQRPLYVVQCSQLGTNEEAIETKLGDVLTRSTRWGAILLIDEADVYIRERGDDIQQNAIVGIFLRVLETYRGVLFLTSNRATIIDDAVLSRATAWVRYTLPTVEQLRRLWEVLSAQYQMPLTNDLVTDLVRTFPRISGRNVKNFLKLASRLGRGLKKTTPDLALFRHVAQYMDVDVSGVGPFVRPPTNGIGEPSSPPIRTKKREKKEEGV